MHVYCGYTTGGPSEYLHGGGQKGRDGGSQQLKAVKGARNAVGVGVAHIRGCVCECACSRGIFRLILGISVHSLFIWNRVTVALAGLELAI